MGMSTYLSDKLIRHTLMNTLYTRPTTVYLALYTTLPSAGNTGGVEVAGGSYAREAVTFIAPSDGTTYNDTVITFNNMPACTIVGAGILDAATSGNLLFYGPFAESRTVVAGWDLAVPVGDVVVVMH